MQIIINATNSVTVTLEERQAVENTVHSALANFESHIQDVTVFLSDDNGPKGGEDQRCRIVTHMPVAGAVTTEEVASNVISAAMLAAEEMAKVVSKYWKRRQVLDRNVRVPIGLEDAPAAEIV